MLRLVPDPLLVIPPGYLVNTHAPLEGRPLSTTPPVATPHVGWVILLIWGSAGVTGWVFMTAELEALDVQPSVFLTVQE